MTLGTVSRREGAPGPMTAVPQVQTTVRQVSGLPERRAVLLLAVTAGTASVARFRVPRASADPRCPPDRPVAARQEAPARRRHLQRLRTTEPLC